MLIPFKKLARKNLIIGHRGASGYAPENTLASFELALQLKTHMIELDIQLTSDRQWIVMHDLTLKRTCGVSKSVSSTALETIKSLDAGSWFSKEFSMQKVMTLKELLSWARNRMNLNLEIKGKLKKVPEDLETLLRIIAESNMAKNAILSSFDWKILRQLRQLDRNLPIGILVNRQPGFLYLTEAIDLKAFSIHLPKRKVKKIAIEKIHAQKMKVYIYTVNHSKEMGKYFSLGADGIFTNYPDLLSGKNS